MNKTQLTEREKAAMKELTKRRALGGFDVNAETIMFLCEDVYEILRHLREQTEKKK